MVVALARHAPERKRIGAARPELDHMPADGFERHSVAHVRARVRLVLVAPRGLVLGLWPECEVRGVSIGLGGTSGDREPMRRGEVGAELAPLRQRGELADLIQGPGEQIRIGGRWHVQIAEPLALEP